MECYDLYIPIGSICRPAYHLKVNDLRDASYPLDWQLAYSLDTVIHLFKTKFEDFFVDIEEDGIGSGNHRRIKDVANDIISIHHFSMDMEMKEAHKEFLEKMRKRFKKLDEKLKTSESVVLICARTDTIEKLQLFLRKFSELYPHLEMKLINIRNDEGMEGNVYTTDKYVLSDKLSMEEYSFNDDFNTIMKEKYDWRGNMEVWAKILKNYYHRHNLEKMQKLKNAGKDIIVYGAGRQCLMLLQKLDKYNIQVKGIAVSDVADNPKSIREYHVDTIEKYDKDDMVVISLEDGKEIEKIKRVLILKGYSHLYFLNQNLIIEDL